MITRNRHLCKPTTYLLMGSLLVFTNACSQKKTDYENFSTLASSTTIHSDDKSIDTKAIVSEVLEDVKKEPIDEEPSEESTTTLNKVISDTIEVDSPDVKSDSSWNSLLKAHSNRISVGASYIGPHPLESHDQDSFAPASITKVITSIMALEALGPDYRFETKLEWKQIGSEAWDVTIVGSGDPTLGVNEFTKDDADVFQTLSGGLVKNGVQIVHGAIKSRANDPIWYSTTPAEGIRESNYVLEDGHFSGYLNYAYNWGTLVINSGGAINWKEPGLNFIVENNLQRSTVKKLYSFSSVRDSNEEIIKVKLSGTHPAHSSSKHLNVPIFNSASWVRNLLSNSIKNQSVKILADDTKSMPLTTFNHIVGKYYSAPLSEILKHQNKNSVNLFADAIYKAAAIKMKTIVPGLNTFTTVDALAIQNLKLFISRWSKKLEDVSLIKSLDIVDGAGLSHSNSVTADAYMQMLLYASKQSYFNYLWNSLSIACVDGTLKSRMCGTAAAKLVHAKTGTINGYYQLAGYIPKMNNNTIEKAVPFVLLTNAPDSLKGSARKFQDRVVAKMTEKVNSR